MFLTEEQYNRILSLLDKRIASGPLLGELNQWSEEQYHLKVHDYICDQTNNGLTRLKIVVWDYIQHFIHGVQCNFTSKQTLDERYQENMFYYHMR